ncbi:NAD(P)/FAD-dependent oxidoreductase [Pseudomonas citronellolis]|uniref:NAD(P)/FAD-dependent oxidoreductase n=1 Tax=Pseudomonas citronellolis TaxID=53408 RepID=A0AAW6P7S4_9PSED|nr:NAD(P)/FAD-dependent oxidoreductase [Pseudomonas citronellolis]MDF3842433.1 NAD(P)/FAD-dependent oxidoreductase [Pseudomonas citronellolis]
MSDVREAKVVPTAGNFDVIVVGAGFAGLYLIHSLRQKGLSVLVFEAGPEVGGTWFWNRYPGARCDIESVIYSYSFSEELQNEWRWSERYATQEEILAYIKHVADRFELRRDIRFNTRVTATGFDERSELWSVDTDQGERFTSRFVIMATGALTVPKPVDIPGLEDFKGTWYHSTNWPAEGVDFTGKRVGLVGTASTGVQMIPLIAQQASQLTVFQRTANFVLPAGNRPLTEDEQRLYRETYPEIRARTRYSSGGSHYQFNDQSALATPAEERQAIYERNYKIGGLAFLGSFNDLLVNEDANKTAADFIRGKIREIVKDPELAEDLCPNDHPLGSKRLCIGSGYLETFNRDNVRLVNLKRTPLKRITADGMQTTSETMQFDVLVFATGFDAITGALSRIQVTGREGRQLKDKWKEGPRCYLGLATAGFPNLFIITGPQSPSALANVVVGIEQHVDWIMDCLDYMKAHGKSLIEPTVEAENAWVEKVADLSQMTLHRKGASWYSGANVPGKPRVFMPFVGGFGNYRRLCDAAAANGYEGFVLSGQTATAQQEELA